LLQVYPNIVVLAYHGGSTDPWQYFNGYAVRGQLGFSAYPTAIVDRRNHPGNGSTFPYVVYTQWTGLVSQRISTAPTTNVDLAVVSQSYNAGTRQFDLVVSATALENMSGQYKISLVLTEDSLIYSQTGNSTCGYPPPDYAHRWTVRSMVNGPSGENLNTAPWNQNQSLTKSFSTTLDPSWVPHQCRFAVLVFKDSSALYYGEIAQAIKGNVAVTTGVEPQPSELPREFSLEQNYPNPFNPESVIKYQLPTITYVTLKVFNALGCEVSTLVDGIEGPGYRSVTWNASELASGVYLYRLSAGGFVQTRKLLLLR
jgi:hypothetical protein